ncbi:hypothetical protein [Frankia sp. AiPa1]|uniref:hypothetical protein n=1 Tax=Frankia sp. AiPa1 TaxID=573492 RepID=UPI00202AF072|nr:hypothetical protein [Frankia sp. AiPa1]MCL9759658.1 hypothetical protein [Frankia sp. AiPa1]
MTAKTRCRGAEMISIHVAGTGITRARRSATPMRIRPTTCPTTNPAVPTIAVGLLVSSSIVFAVDAGSAPDVAPASAVKSTTLMTAMMAVCR